MASFFKNLVGMLRTRKAAAPEAYFAAFGKHPGWNDHVDVGLETEQLVALKGLLYVQGIGPNVDAGAWDKLEAGQQLDGFQHTFFWYTPDDYVLGRFWSSVDGKGRSKYPMVLAAEGVAVPLGWMFSSALPRVEDAVDRCVQATEAEVVIKQIDNTRVQLRQALPETTTSNESDFFISPQMIAAVAEHRDLGPNHQGFCRILYQISRGMATYRPTAEGGSRKAAERPEHLRVPLCGMGHDDAILFWLRFLLSQLDDDTPILFLAPRGHAFVDIVVGDVGPQQMFSVRASPGAVPLTSDIPYTLDQEFIAAANEFIQQCRVAQETQMPELPWES